MSGEPTYYRKVIRITAEDSPNVQYARAQILCGEVPTNKIIIPGVMPWADYQKRRATWDAIRQSIGLDAQFYEGAEVLLFPPQWRALAEAYWVSIQGNTKRQALGVGVDPGEGSANTSYTAVDMDGIIEIQSYPTPDTNAIPTITQDFVNKHNCPWTRVVFDRGGGGKQHADRLRAMGYPVRTVGFGQQISVDLRRGMRMFTERLDVEEEKQVYVNRRAQMYGTLSELLHPDSVRRFGIPPQTYNEAAERLHRALSVIPRLYDPEDRLLLPPKNRKPGQKEGTGLKTLVELIGFSPDEADSAVLAVEGMLGQSAKSVAGAV